MVGDRRQGSGEAFSGICQRSSTAPTRRRPPQGQARGEDRQPDVLLEEQSVRALRCPGHPDSEVVAEAPQLVVPATGAERQRAVGQIRMLIAEQVPDQLSANLTLGSGHAGNLTGETVACPRSQEPLA